MISNDKGDISMSNHETNNDQNTQPTEKKKVSLQELMKQQLANKKQAQANGTQANKGLGQNQKMKSQQAKKTSTTRRKMGS
jgi:hypothetical protein